MLRNEDFEKKLLCKEGGSVCCIHTNIYTNHLYSIFSYMINQKQFS